MRSVFAAAIVLSAGLIGACSMHPPSSSTLPHMFGQTPPSARPRLAPGPEIYVTQGNNEIDVFLQSDYGDVFPQRVIFGSHSELSGPQGIAADSDGFAYVANNSDSLLTFGPGANGNQNPKFVATCGGLVAAQGVAVSRNRYIFVAENESGPQAAVTIFAPYPNGCVANNQQISGPDTALQNPTDVAIGPHGKIYVSGGAGQITEYARGSAGDARPVVVIKGQRTRLTGEIGIAVDDAGEIYVTDFQTRCIDIFHAGANGNVAPARRIQGPSTGLVAPAGIGVSDTGEIYVVDQLSQAIRVFPTGANGNVSPIRTITGPNTGLINPDYLALYEPK